MKPALHAPDPPPARPEAQRPVRVVALRQGVARTQDDVLAVEAPLQIRIADGPDMVTMRTPGHDLELAAGLLYSEGLVRRREDFLELAYCEALDDIVRVRLSDTAPQGVNLERSGLISSACGVCGKAELDRELLAQRPPPPKHHRVDAAVILTLPTAARRAQEVFASTGGLHAAALFDTAGRLLDLREDVGRHNALDKLIGHALLDDRLPLHEHIVLLSGRASYELIQKCGMAGIPIVCAVSAPSSYAVELASDLGLTLLGFLRSDRFNIYSHPERIRGLDAQHRAADAALTSRRNHPQA